MIYLRLFFFSLSYCLSIGVHADIGVSPIVVDLINKDADAEIAVKNFDTKHNAYVEITPYRLVNPAMPDPLKKRVRHPEKDGLLIFPAKLTLLPGQTQFVRIVKTVKSVSKERVYEVDFTPKVSTQLVSKKTANGSMLGIRVIVGYGARVTLRPDVPVPSLSVHRVNNELVIKNTGNTSIHITSCTQQISGKKTELALPAYTLFVGQTIKKKLPQLTQVATDASFMGKSLGSFYTD